MFDTTCPLTAPSQQEAAEWYAVLSSGEVSDSEKVSGKPGLTLRQSMQRHGHW